MGLLVDYKEKATSNYMRFQVKAKQQFNEKEPKKRV